MSSMMDSIFIGVTLLHLYNSQGQIANKENIKFTFSVSGLILDLGEIPVPAISTETFDLPVLNFLRLSSVKCHMLDAQYSYGCFKMRPCVCSLRFILNKVKKELDWCQKIWILVSPAETHKEIICFF